MIETILEELQISGLLLKTDAKLPNVCAIVAGEPVRGSWWAHPKSHQIFHALAELAAHRDVLTAKLVSGKDTFLHRAIWPAFLTVARSGEAWQFRGLDGAARKLFEEVEEKGVVATSGREALALEKALLVHGAQVHEEEGSHGKVLTSWTQWTKSAGLKDGGISPEEGRASLEKLLAHLNARHAGAGRLPWRSNSMAISGC